LFFIFLALDIAVFTSVIYLDYNIGEAFKIKKGDVLNIESPIPVTAVYNGTQLSKNHTTGDKRKLDVDIKAFGVIPIGKASVEIVDEMQVVVLGTPFGMKLYTEGVLVVNLTDVETVSGKVNPAKLAGIEKGDYILSVNGDEISTNEELLDAVEKSKGTEMTFQILRDKKQFSAKVTAAISKDTGSYKIGIWVRDSSAGIGTLTFYSPATDVLCGLGHGVCDEDTGEILKLDSGEIVSAEIFSVVKGKKGNPGQLKGRFTDTTLGEILLNCSGGVYCLPTVEFTASKLTEIAFKNEIKAGKAQIYCAVDGDVPKLFDCEVEFKKGKFDSDTHNMIVTVTDKELLKTTGGIVQGLSGSPILQDGKLIGALTHVLVNDPTKGYAIFAENMLENAQNVAEKHLKEAS